MCFRAAGKVLCSTDLNLTCKMSTIRINKCFMAIFIIIYHYIYIKSRNNHYETTANTRRCTH